MSFFVEHLIAMFQSVLNTAWQSCFHIFLARAKRLAVRIGDWKCDRGESPRCHDLIALSDLAHFFFASGAQSSWF